MTQPKPTKHSPLQATYITMAPAYFERRGLRRYAGIWSLWALGVGAVISGHFPAGTLGRRWAAGAEC